MTEPYADLAEMTHLRRQAYRLLAGLFLYPDRTRLDSLAALAAQFQVHGEALAALAFFQPWRRLLDALQRLRSAGPIETIEKDYIPLFLLKPRSPLYESFYLDPYRQAAGQIIAELAAEYSAQGLVLSPALRLPPDHLAVELEYAAFLCTAEGYAWEGGAQEEGIEMMHEEYAFLTRHLATWLPTFARRVAKANGEGLYAIAAGAAHTFVQHDKDLLDLWIEQFS